MLIHTLLLIETNLLSDRYEDYVSGLLKLFRLFDKNIDNIKNIIYNFEKGGSWNVDEGSNEELHSYLYLHLKYFISISNILDNRLDADKYGKCFKNKLANFFNCKEVPIYINKIFNLKDSDEKQFAIKLLDLYILGRVELFLTFYYEGIIPIIDKRNISYYSNALFMLIKDVRGASGIKKNGIDEMYQYFSRYFIKVKKYLTEYVRDFELNKFIKDLYLSEKEFFEILNGITYSDIKNLYKFILYIDSKIDLSNINNKVKIIDQIKKNIKGGIIQDDYLKASGMESFLKFIPRRYGRSMIECLFFSFVILFFLNIIIEKLANSSIFSYTEEEYCKKFDDFLNKEGDFGKTGKYNYDDCMTQSGSQKLDDFCSQYEESTLIATRFKRRSSNSCTLDKVSTIKNILNRLDGSRPSYLQSINILNDIDSSTTFLGSELKSIFIGLFSTWIATDKGTAITINSSMNSLFYLLPSFSYFLIPFIFCTTLFFINERKENNMALEREAKKYELSKKKIDLKKKSLQIKLLKLKNEPESGIDESMDEKNDVESDDEESNGSDITDEFEDGGDAVNSQFLHKLKIKANRKLRDTKKAIIEEQRPSKFIGILKSIGKYFFTGRKRHLDDQEKDAKKRKLEEKNKDDLNENAHEEEQDFEDDEEIKKIKMDKGESTNESGYSDSEVIEKHPKNHSRYKYDPIKFYLEYYPDFIITTKTSAKLLFPIRHPQKYGKYYRDFLNSNEFKKLYKEFVDFVLYPNHICDGDVYNGIDVIIRNMSAEFHIRSYAKESKKESCICKSIRNTLCGDHCECKKQGKKCNDHCHYGFTSEDIILTSYGSSECSNFATEYDETEELVVKIFDNYNGEKKLL